jgi:general secretion pathway protein F
MRRFRYRALTDRGAADVGTIDATDPADAVARLQARGLLPVEAVALADTDAATGRAAPGQRLRVGDRLRFFNEFRLLTAAGVPLDRALALLAARTAVPALHALATRLGSAVRAGRPLSEAVAEDGRLGADAAALIEAGEAAGTLDAVLRALVAAAEREQAIARTVVGSLTYPLVVIVVAAMALTVMLGVVLPRFAALFVGLDRPVPAMTQGLLWLGQGLVWGLPALALSALVLIAMRGGPAGLRRWIVVLADALPVLGPFRRRLAAERSTRTLGLLLAGGVPLADALGHAASAAGGGPVALDWIRARDALRAGRSLSAGLGDATGLPPLARELAAVGEATGRLASVMQGHATLLADDLDRDVARFTALFAPAVTLVLGAAIGLVVLSLVSAVMDLYTLPL